MKISAEWVKRDFKQKYFLYCRDCKFSVKKLADVKDYSYLSPRIKIITL